MSEAPPAGREGHDRGVMTAFVVMLAIILLSCLGLAFDGGRIVDSRLHAADLAKSAARAGAQELQSLRAGRPELDPLEAVEAAESFLRAQGVTGQAVVRAGRVVVTVRLTVDLPLLALVGIKSRSVAATRASEPIPYP